MTGDGLQACGMEELLRVLVHVRYDTVHVLVDIPGSRRQLSFIHPLRDRGWTLQILVQLKRARVPTCSIPHEETWG